MKAALSTATSKGHITVVNLLIGHEAKLGLARAETVGVIRRATRDARTQVRRSTCLAALGASAEAHT